MFKMVGDSLLKSIRILLNKCHQEETMPKTWQNANVILVHKKGDSNTLENFLPISLLSDVYKLVTKIITNRLTTKLDFYQPPEQACFRKGYITVDHLQVLRLLIGGVQNIILRCTLPLQTTRRHLTLQNFQRYSKQCKMHELILDTQACLNQFTAMPQ